jgi:hypothetical protein
MRRINCLLEITFHGWAALSGFTKTLLCILVVIGGAIVSSAVFSKGFSLDLLSVRLELEKDKAAPVDYGRVRPLGLRAQTECWGKPRPSPKKRSRPRQRQAQFLAAEARGAFLVPHFVGLSYQFIWRSCPMDAF